jgi:hypothetical protein
MTSPGTARASSLKHAPPTLAGRPRLRQRLLAEHPAVLDLLVQPVGSLGDEVVTLDFGQAPFAGVPAHTTQPFGELVIVTGDSPVRVGPPDDGASDRWVLTGTRGRHNDCLLLFRHAFGTVTCQLGVGNIAADAHVGFLQHGDFAEVRTFSFTRPRERQQGGAAFWTTLAYSARHLNELQGIVWRGGTLCIEGLRLEP